MRKSTCLVLMLLGAQSVSAESLQFQAINPSFGGNPLNAGHLMGLATKQYTPPKVEKTVTSDIQYFADQIQRRTLSAISSAFTENLRNIDLNDPNSTLPDDFTVGDITISYGTFQNNITLTLKQGEEVIEIIVPSF